VRSGEKILWTQKARKKETQKACPANGVTFPPGKEKGEGLASQKRWFKNPRHRTYATGVGKNHWGGLGIKALRFADRTHWAALSRIGIKMAVGNTLADSEKGDTAGSWRTSSPQET